MKFTKLILLALVVPSLIFLYQNLSAFSGGIVGQTKRSTTTGCSCHGSSATTSVSAIIVGPTILRQYEIGTYQLRLSGGPLVKGGCDISPKVNQLELSPLETGLQRLSASGGIFELTHTEPKAPNVPTNDTIVWTFRYVASTIPASAYDTIYANGNSVNGTGGTAGDQWNFAVNFAINITPTAGIVNLNHTAESYKLSQNYPNPFNPVTKINYSILKSGFVSIKVYNQLGQMVEALVNENQTSGTYEVDFNGSAFSSGLYYYSIESNGLSETKKMILSK